MKGGISLENEDFKTKNKPSLPMDHFKKENDDLIETDDELLEVGSNENPDGSDEEEDDEDDDREDSNLTRPLDFTTGRKLSDSGKQSEINYFKKSSPLELNDKVLEWFILNCDSEEEVGQDYFRPLKRLAEDCDRDGNPLSQIGSNNSSHTTKKKGRRKCIVSNRFADSNMTWNNFSLNLYHSLTLRCQVLLYR